MRHSQFRYGSAATAILAVLAAGCAAPPPAPEVPERPNATITRTISGTLVCHTMQANEDCGADRFILTVQADGSRTLRSFVNVANAGSQLNMVYRATGDFRFLEAYEQAYYRGKLAGSGLYVADGSSLRVITHTPAGLTTESLPVPEHYSVILHPVSVDGWHFAQYDDAVSGDQPLRIYEFGQGARLVAVDMPLKFVREETLTVPAGTFLTRHYHLGKDADVWITGADRIMVRHEFRAMDTRFELARLTGPVPDSATASR